ncbi:FMN-binding glutamate synthase family protein [Candidatus Pacearchaeota archaeon]|nr:FMN-binding glutamate synthase family protein [Candidatus Pacearchaeota archaeon]
MPSDAQKRVGQMAKDGSAAYRGGATQKYDFWEDISILAAQVGMPPFDSYKEDFDISLKLGGRYSKNILSLNMPIVVAAMSYGAISRTAKLAIHDALNELAIEGIKLALNTGEGGALPEELNEHEYNLIVQYASGRFGVNLDYLKKADAIEIKLGQGAKVGLGGHLLEDKITEDVARQRQIPIGVSAFSPARHMDIIGPEDLDAKVSELREITDWEKPILVKVGASYVKNDAEIITKSGADAMVVDGSEGGTGAAPLVAAEHLGINTVAAIPAARRSLDISIQNLYNAIPKNKGNVELRDVQLIGSGGLWTSDRIVKAMALGADCVGIASGILIAMGCTQCQQCHEGRCVKGIATQDQELEKKLDREEVKMKIKNYIYALRDEIKKLNMAAGFYKIGDMTIENLRTCNVNVSAMTGIKMQGSDVIIGLDRQ